MNIAIISHSAGGGGAERVAVNLANHLLNENEVFFCAVHSDRREYYLDPKVQYDYIGTERSGFRGQLSIAINLRKYIKKNNIEVMISLDISVEGIAEKYRATSYKSLKRKISSLSDILDNAYGKSYCQISNPTLIGNVVNLGIANANKRKSRDVTHSFGMKLRALMLGKEVEITFCDVQRTKKKYKFTDEERLSFVLFGILYASRCNNFHGNVAARMNSINANKDTFKMYTDMFLTEYIILAIHLNSQGALPDMVLNKVKENANLMV